MWRGPYFLLFATVAPQGNEACKYLEVLCVHYISNGFVATTSAGERKKTGTQKGLDVSE
jgi:hypothetical protein